MKEWNARPDSLQHLVAFPPQSEFHSMLVIYGKLLISMCTIDFGSLIQVNDKAKCSYPASHLWTRVPFKGLSLKKKNWSAYLAENIMNKISSITALSSIIKILGCFSITLKCATVWGLVHACIPLAVPPPPMHLFPNIPMPTVTCRNIADQLTVCCYTWCISFQGPNKQGNRWITC